MPEAIELGVNVSEAIGDIEDLEGDLRELQRRIEHEIDEAVRETAEDFRDEVIAQIEASEIDSDTGELLSSWKVRARGRVSYQVYSTADHAIFLEEGTDPHEINGNPWLIFEAEPGTYDDYPKHTQVGGGMIKIHKVNHPGNDAYEYFTKAYEAKSWRSSLNSRVRHRIRPIIEEFERS